MNNINIWQGLAITFGVLIVAKIVIYRFTKKELRKPFNTVFFTADSWMDFVIHLSVTWAFFFFEHDILSWINPILERNEVWTIPHPENKGFIFILIPILISTVGYKLARKFISKPIQKKLTPEIHNKYCKD